jgi:hypothetical protein
LTIAILLAVVFFLGFFADPIINLYVDPWSFLSPWSSSYNDYYYEDEPASWYEHFAKGLASMGVLGFLKALLASPLQLFRMGGGRGRNTARERYEQVSWIIIVIGVGTFLLVSAAATPGLQVLLTAARRLSTAECVLGVAARLRKLANESWTFKAMTTTMMSSFFLQRIQVLLPLGIFDACSAFPFSLVYPHTS